MMTTTPENLNNLLVYAIKNCNESECNRLIKLGADVLLKNNFGELPSDVYLKNNTTASKIHKYLRQKEKEREMLAQCFKRAHIENDDSES